MSEKGTKAILCKYRVGTFYMHSGISIVQIQGGSKYEVNRLKSSRLSSVHAAEL